jgi:hypothetical protein
MTKEAPKNISNLTNAKKSEPKFYSVNVKNDSQYDIIINHYRLIDLLKSFGFYRYDLNNEGDFVFIKIENNIVQQVDRQHIIDYFIDWLNQNHSDELVSLEELKNKIYKGLDSYFSRNLLARLTLDKPLHFLTDTKEKAFFYFKNGIVTVTRQNVDFQPYSQKFEGYLWKNQILERNFESADHTDSVFGEFCYLIAKEKKENLFSLCSLIGYLLHDYKDGKRKAINFTDSSLDTKNNGRSGKTLLSKSLGKLRIYKEINGKDFKPENKHKYQDCNLDTQIINLNDVTKHFDLESVYNDITENICVEGKNKKPFYIITKMIICSNRPLEVSSGSDKDRVIEFEFSNFFSEKHSPENQFGHWFFSDWTAEEWHRFDNFILECVSIYLRNGIINPMNENLKKRKLLIQTSEEFLIFMDLNDLKPNQEYNKKELYEAFIKFTSWNSEKFSQRSFTKWLRTFAEFSENFGEFKERNDKNKSVCYIEFIKKADYQ